MRIQCSCCGQTKIFRGTEAAIRRQIADGWGSFGSALYCPACSATWHERNGLNRPMAGPEHTLTLMQNRR